MTKTDTSPPGAEVEESQSELLFQALERFIENVETSKRTLEWIEEQAREGSALRGLTEEATEEHLNDALPAFPPCLRARSRCTCKLIQV